MDTVINLDKIKGGQMCGFAGKHWLKKTGAKFARITGLDPCKNWELRNMRQSYSNVIGKF